MLTAIIFLPAAGSLLIGLAGRSARVVRGIALATVILELALTLWLFAAFSRDVPGFDMVQRTSWIDAFNIQYLVGVDGLSAPLVLLNGILGLSAVLVSWHIQVRVREYFILLLVLQTSVMGVFLSLDLILFFVFWELELVPMYLLISVWGTGRREYSAMKFLIFTFLGSAFMFAAILTLYFSFSGAERTFDMTLLATRDLGALLVPSMLVFTGFLVAFAVKLPLFPLHTWLPDAHTDAPTAVSVMLAGVLLKMGGYGLIRINAGMFPDQMVEVAPVLAALAVVSVLYGAFIVLRQSDLKRLVAYSSVSHMGFVVLGVSSLGAASGELSPVGLNGAAMQLFTHGTITGLLFVVVGLIYERAHTRHIPDLGGLASRMPLIAAGFLLAGLASLGLPATSGFVAELLVFLGTFPVWGPATVLAAFGVVLAAGYILWMAQRTLFGPRPARYDALPDASLVEAASMAVLLVPIMVVGLYPRLLTDVFDSGIAPIIMRFG
jgi:NADH-quinone oxidoreductase subunit M